MMTKLRCRHRSPIFLLAELVGLVVAAVGASGCGFNRDLAHRTTLGGNAIILALSPDDASMLETNATTTTKITRSNWQPIDFIVPVDGTIHGPIWRWDARLARDTAMQKALYPTIETALEDEGAVGPQIRAALVQPFISIGNIFAIPVLAFTDPPGTTMTPTARTLYKRSIRGRSVAGIVPVESDTPPRQTEDIWSHN